MKATEYVRKATGGKGSYPSETLTRQVKALEGPLFSVPLAATLFTAPLAAPLFTAHSADAMLCHALQCRALL